MSWWDDFLDWGKNNGNGDGTAGSLGIMGGRQKAANELLSLNESLSTGTM